MFGESPEFQSFKGKISDNTLKALVSQPFKLKHTSPVQAEVLKLLPSLADPYDPNGPTGQDRPVRDLLVKAKTGTGKTLAFLIPALEARMKYLDAAVQKEGLDPDSQEAARRRRAIAREEVGTIIISPTRELATQIANEALRLAHWNREIGVRTLIGGASKRQQLSDWARGRPDIVVATPGRLRDILENHPDIAQSIRKAHTLILDEADTLLDMGFRDDLEGIVRELPKTPERQTFLFSATISRPIQQITKAFLDSNRHFIDVVPVDDSPVHAHVPQYHTILPSAEHQIPHVLRLIAHDQLVNAGKSKILLFLPTTKVTQLFSTLLRELKKSLPASRGTHVYELHSKKNQSQRTRTSDDFRADKSGASILVSSDVSARGVDYPGITRVIQVGIPSSSEQYVHRVGRTGRAGSAGRGDLVLLPWEKGFLTYSLSDVPIKPLSVEELQSEVTKIAEKHDADRDAFWASAPPHTVREYPPTVAKVLAETDANIAALHDRLDEDAVKETLAALLGYYLGQTGALGVDRAVVLQGLRDWTTQACGLPKPPHVSDAFLARLGFRDPAPKGRDYKRRANTLSDGGRRPPFSDWAERGRDVRRSGFDSGRKTFGVAGRPSGYSGDRERRPSSYGDRERRPSFGGRDGERERRPSWNRDSGERRPRFNRDSDASESSRKFEWD
ncbi:DEAD-domain-containing protein [Dentipellis sp. KUC8613]|nr:DEAD-domain-containing protein [Dentipellis sp. KUC8613]